MILLAVDKSFNVLAIPVSQYAAYTAAIKMAYKSSRRTGYRRLELEVRKIISLSFVIIIAIVIGLRIYSKIPLVVTIILSHMNIKITKHIVDNQRVSDSFVYIADVDGI